MYKVVRTRQFEKSYRKLKKSGVFKPSVKQNLEEAIVLLADGKSLPISYADHKLSGELQQYRECHIKGNLLLEYEYRNDILVLVLVDIGSHSQLFG